MIRTALTTIVLTSAAVVVQAQAALAGVAWK